jgi:hypothetical protein
VLFGSFNQPGPVYNAGWQWLGDQSLTVGSNYTPTVRMLLYNSGTLYIPSQSTAILFNGGSIVSTINPNMNYAMGADYSGGNWVAQSTSGADYTQYMGGGLPSHEWLVATGMTVGGGVPWTVMGTMNSNGWNMNGTNPVMILQSNTNTNADILEVLAQNQTAGQALLYSGLHSIGSSAAVSMSIDAKGGAAINVNGNNTGGIVQVFSSLLMVNNNHLYSQLNGSPNAPAVASCAVAAAMRAGSTDVSGQVYFGATGAMSTCLINFGQAWANSPNCTCSFEQGNNLPGQCGTNTSTTQLNFEITGNVTNTTYAQINYICIGI